MADAGTLWVNGRQVASHNIWHKPFVVNIASYIRPGKNEIAMVVRNHSGAGGLLKGVRLLRELKILKPLVWEVSADMGGVVQGIHEGNRQGGWRVVSLDTRGEIK